VSTVSQLTGAEQVSDTQKIDGAARKLFKGLRYLLQPEPTGQGDIRKRARDEAETNFAQGLAGVVDALKGS
jgi:hypothetical protein